MGRVGAAYAVWHIHEGNERHPQWPGHGCNRRLYLGPESPEKEISRKHCKSPVPRPANTLKNLTR